jgi:hypothetical protein
MPSADGSVQIWQKCITRRTILINMHSKGSIGPMSPTGLDPRRNGEKMDQLERLTAIEDIKQMKARYFRCVDSKDWHDFADLFTPNAEFHSTWAPTAEGGIIRGNQEIAKVIGGQMDDLVSVHHGFMPEIEVTSATTANGIWAMEDILKRPGGEGVRRSGGSGTWSMHGFGHYHETYEKIDGQWRIASLKVNRIRLE